MAASRYATAPIPSDRMPPGIPFIIGNEAAERFSFYGMRGILVVFMTKHLLGADGELAAMTDEEAKKWFHLFVASAYFFPILGAVLSDWWLGKYRTILWLSIVYCLGHLALALDVTRLGLAAGLTLIAVGSGGIKPCVSAHVGDQFGSRNQHLLSKAFSWFYFSINLGAFISTLLTPYLLKKYGPHVAFGVPGALMLAATVLFWMGRHRFVHVPPGGRQFLRESFSGEGLAAIGRLVPIYLFVAMFWCLFDQTASAWVLQADSMDRRWEVGEWLGGVLAWLPSGLQTIEWLPAQIQAVNPILILIFIPLFAYVIYPGLNRVFTLTPLRKISIGMFVTVLAFLISGWIEVRIQAGGRPDIAWQFVAYAVITAAEVMVSITCLEFSYTQAPKRMKSLIMAFYLLSVTLGNAFTSVVNAFILNEDKSSKLPGADYYWFFSGTMFAAALGFVFLARTYRGTTYLQDEPPSQIEAEAVSKGT